MLLPPILLLRRRLIGSLAGTHSRGIVLPEIPAKAGDRSTISGKWDRRGRLTRPRAAS